MRGARSRQVIIVRFRRDLAQLVVVVGISGLSAIVFQPVSPVCDGDSLFRRRRRRRRRRRPAGRTAGENKHRPVSYASQRSFGFLRRCVCVCVCVSALFQRSSVPAFQRVQ